MKIHLITYGNDYYFFQREIFRKSAIESAFFDEVVVFTPEDLDPEFTTKFKEVLQLPRGGGYWIWKPYLIKKALAKLNDGDILIYCDAGCTINASGRKRYEKYVNQLITSENGLIAFQLKFKAYLYTKMEIFKHFSADEHTINSYLYVAGIVPLKKCAHSTMIIDKWVKTIYDDAWLFTDRLSGMAQHKEFIDNRHDQSVYGVLINTYGADKIPDETYFHDFEKEGKDFPFWATRLNRTS